MAPFSTPPPLQSFAVISFPSQHVLLVTFNRPKSLNCMTSVSQYELEQLFTWYDEEPELRCAIVTGSGRAFCAGQDLKEWNETNQRIARGESRTAEMMPRSGFGGLSRRHGKKPIIGAINGLAFGGGMEIVANLDIVVAARSATFALPEVKRGVVAFAGSLPRLMRNIGRPLIMQLALTGMPITAEEGKDWGFINSITDDAPADTEITDRPVVRKALDLAKMISNNSPDSVIVTRMAALSGWEDGSVENATRLTTETWRARLEGGTNSKEGLLAFSEKRVPRWTDSKL